LFVSDNFVTDFGTEAMTERKRLILLILIMVNSPLVVGGVAIFVLYRTAMTQTNARLVETAQSQARLIEAVARFDAVYSKDYPEGPQAATLSQVIDAHKNYKGFGETGEFTLARREAGQIVFLLSHRHFDLGNPKPVPFDSELAEPMRRALKGESDTMVGLDYRGKTVLAAYEPVAELNLGIVAKIDLAEIRRPFIKARLFGLGIALLVVLFGSVVFWEISEPMIRHIRDREERLSAILDTAIEGIITINTQGIIESVNPAAETMFGYTSSEVIGRNVKILMLSPYQEEHDGYLARYLETGEAKIICIGREVVGLRKDGSTFPIELAVSEVGQLGIFTGVIRDVTEQKETEAQIMQAERLSAIGEAMTALMHESRNALQRSQASLERLGRRIQDRPEVTEFINDLKEAQDDLHRLYEEVREFAAPIKIKPKRCRLDEIVRQAWDNLDPMHNGRKVRLQEHGVDFDLHCNVDEFEIRQVIRNILKTGLEPVPIRGKSMCNTPKPNWTTHRLFAL
jgi:PAS domain S-box-containing protein